MLQGIHVAYRRLVEQILNCTPVVQAAAYLRNEFVGNVHSKTAAPYPSIKHMAKVLFTIEAGLTVLSNAAGTAQTQRSQSRRPKGSNVLLKPMRNIFGEFFLYEHEVHVTLYHMYSQVISSNYFVRSGL